MAAGEPTAHLNPNWLARQVEMQNGALYVRLHDPARRASVGFVGLGAAGDAEQRRADARHGGIDALRRLIAEDGETTERVVLVRFRVPPLNAGRERISALMR